MTRYEDFPKKCIRCKRSDVELTRFSYGKSHRTYLSEIYTNYSVTFPVCFECEAKLKKYLRIKDNTENFLIGFCCTLMIGFMLGIAMWTGNLQLQLFQYLLYDIAILFGIMTISIFIITLVHPDRISKYIRIRKNGSLVIKDLDYKQSVEETSAENIAVKLFGPDEDDKMFCVNCGAKHRKGTDFCTYCGKDLRSIHN